MLVRTVKWYDRLGNQGTANVLMLAILLAFTVEYSIPTTLALASQAVNCVCKGFGNFRYAVAFESKPTEELVCGSGVYDHCTCYDDNGNAIDIDIQHLEWDDDSRELKIDMNCRPHRRNKREAPKADKEIVERKTNILSRSISGVGTVISGTGNAISTGVGKVGNITGDVVSGGFHLIGTATKTVTDIVGGSINAVASTLESKKIKTETHPPSSRKRRSIEGAEAIGGTITNDRQLNELADGMDIFVKEISKIKDVLNSHDTVAEAKAAMMALADAEQDSGIKEVYVTFADMLQPSNVDHQVDELEVISSINTENVHNASIVERIRTIKKHLTDSDSVPSFYTRMSRDSSIGGVERKFVDYLGAGLKKDMHCDNPNLGIKINPVTSLKEVIDVLQQWASVCDTQSPIIDEAVKVLSKLGPQTRHKRAAVDEAKKIKKKMIKKAAKTKPAGSLKKKKHAASSHAHGEHEEHEEQATHMEEDPSEEDEEMEEAEDGHDDHAKAACVCDPDTCKPLHQ